MLDTISGTLASGGDVSFTGFGKFTGVNDFTYVLVDCPPSLNLLTLNALVVADAVIVPLQCEFYALEGLSHLMQTIEQVRKVFNPGLHIQGLVLTMYDRRNRFTDQIQFSFIPVAKFININTALAHGAELELSGRINRRLTLNGGYIYTAAQALDTPLCSPGSGCRPTACTAPTSDCTCRRSTRPS